MQSRRPARFFLLVMAALLMAGPLLIGLARAQDIRFFQLGTGPTGETRFPMGGLIANALSNPPGSRECEKGGSCGVPGLVAVAKSTGGSVANVEALQQKRLDAALVQADIAYWAVQGAGIYKAKGPVRNLRAIAMVYPESLHLVARREARINSVRDLKGKKVWFGEAESTAQSHGRLLLQAYKLPESQVKIVNLKAAQAADAIAAGQLDAMLVVDAYPVAFLSELVRTVGGLQLVPLFGPEVESLRAQYPFLAAGAIPDAAYDGAFGTVKTLDVGVALVTNAEQPAELIQGVTRALWHPSTQKLLHQGSPRGRVIGLDAKALERMGIPLHPGAARYYADAGLGN